VDRDQDVIDRKIRILTNEYTTVRTEIRIYSILEIIFVCVSILIFRTMFMLGTISNQYILLFISPMVSMLLLIMGLAMNAYTSNLALLASEIEDSLNELLGEELVKWESTAGIFGGSSKDFMVKRLGKAWFTISLF
jgi:hypothetical protein